MNVVAETAPALEQAQGYGLARWRDRRRLVRCEREAAHLAGLHHLRTLLGEAVGVVSRGWLQHAWFQYLDADGRPRLATAQNVHLVGHPQVTGACLVGAIVHVGGGTRSAHTQPVRRALDLTWHTLYRDPDQPVEWCPAPPVRNARVRDLTQWNDQPYRAEHEVVDLLLAARQRAGAEISVSRASTS